MLALFAQCLVVFLVIYETAAVVREYRAGHCGPAALGLKVLLFVLVSFILTLLILQVHSA